VLIQYYKLYIKTQIEQLIKILNRRL